MGRFLLINYNPIYFCDKYLFTNFFKLMFQANDLPKSIQEESFQPTEFAEDFKIAWRYKQNPIYDSKPHHTSTSFGHTFDMTTKIPVDELQNIRYWPTKESLGIHRFICFKFYYFIVMVLMANSQLRILCLT